MTGATEVPATWKTLSVLLTAAELEVLEGRIATEEGAAPEKGAAPEEGSAPEDGPPPEEPDEVDRSALLEAVRSLTLRGVLGTDGRLGEDLVGLWLDVALSSRLGAGLVLRVVRTLTGAGEGVPATDPEEDPHGFHDERRVHLADGVACVEELLPGGVRLTLAEPGQVAADVVAACVPQDAAAGAGPAFTHVLEGVTRPDGPLSRALGRPTTVLRLEADVPEHARGRAGLPASLPPPSCHVVALGPRGCWAADLPPGPRPAAPEFRPVGPGWVEDWVRARTGPVAGQGTMAG